MAKVVVAQGVTRQVLASGQGLTVVEFVFRAGSEHPWHSHVHEQASYIKQGRFKLVLEDKEIVLEEGMAAIIPPHVRHKGMALTDTVKIDSFTPVREDLVKD